MGDLDEHMSPIGPSLISRGEIYGRTIARGSLSTRPNTDDYRPAAGLLRVERAADKPPSTGM
jgi:hypothetical protein